MDTQTRCGRGYMSGGLLQIGLQNSGALVEADL